MYIPVSYWQTQGSGIAHVKGNYFVPSFPTVPQSFNYTFDNNPVTQTASVKLALYPVCKDITTQNQVYRQYPNVLPAGAFFFCSANAPSGTININTPPNTGAEARYINVRYEAPSDLGTFYYSYVNEKAEIVNDTLVYNESKNIIAQGPPIWMQQDSSIINYRIDYTIGEKFSGNTIAYPFIDIPVDVTFQLKRAATGGGSFDMPQFQFRARIFKNGFPIANNSGSNAGRAASSLNGTTTLGTIGIPIPQQDNGLTTGIIVPCTWITNVSPQTKGALFLTSCTTTHSLWVTLNDYSYYETGSVLKVTNSELTSTSSCWTVSNLTSSLDTSVAVNNVNISASFGTCFGCISGSITSSLNVEYLLVAGGGGGGAGNSGNGPGAGGGAGGLLSGSYTLIPQTTYSVIIGNGGGGGTTNAATGSNGLNSSLFGYTTIGGGGGAGNNKTGSNGGSGGGSGARSGTAISGGLATSGQGNNGGPGGAGSNLYPGGGGGGASSEGTAWIFNAGPGYLSFAGSGGSGSQWLDGNYYAGGGSGGGTGNNGVNPGTPGIGGGGTGGDEQFGTLATPGQANRGAGGGGGASYSPITGASGSAGISIVRYPGTTQLIGGGNVTFSGSYVYHTFTSSAALST